MIHGNSLMHDLINELTNGLIDCIHSIDSGADAFCLICCWALGSAGGRRASGTRAVGGFLSGLRGVSKFSIFRISTESACAEMVAVSSGADHRQRHSI